MEQFSSIWEIDKRILHTSYKTYFSDLFVYIAPIHIQTLYRYLKRFESIILSSLFQDHILFIMKVRGRKVALHHG